jgi:hypothetical protein
MKVPTDLQILQSVYDRYYSEFEAFKTGEKNSRASKVYVPIDVDLIGEKLGVDGDIIFGRLYYHFNNKYSFGKVEFFSLSIGEIGKQDKHCIQFPYMASVLADLQNENTKFRIATRLAWVSIGISIIALVVSAFS